MMIRSELVSSGQVHCVSLAAVQRSSPVVVSGIACVSFCVFHEVRPHSFRSRRCCM